MSSGTLGELEIDAAVRSRLAADYARFSGGLPRQLEEYVRDQYRLDLSSEYGGLPVKNPFGKASGQLSLNLQQGRRDAARGPRFVLLKTIIAEDEQGGRSMSDWALPETRMVVERIKGA